MNEQSPKTSDLDARATTPGISTLEYACEDVFLSILRLRSEQAPVRDSKADFEALKRALDKMKSNAIALGEDTAAIELARYALSALADETMAPLHVGWSSKLAIACVKDHSAGEGFFTNAEALLASRQRPDLARIYAMCLAFGFRGKYATHKPGELEAIRRELADFGDDATVSLCESAQRPQEAFARVAPRLPAIYYAGMFACFALAFAWALSAQLDRRSVKAAAWLDTQHPRRGVKAATRQLTLQHPVQLSDAENSGELEATTHRTSNPEEIN